MTLRALSADGCAYIGIGLTWLINLLLFWAKESPYAYRGRGSKTQEHPALRARKKTLSYF